MPWMVLGLGLTGAVLVTIAVFGILVRKQSDAKLIEAECAAVEEFVFALLRSPDVVDMQFGRMVNDVAHAQVVSRLLAIFRNLSGNEVGRIIKGLSGAGLGDYARLAARSSRRAQSVNAITFLGSAAIEGASDVLHSVVTSEDYYVRLAAARALISVEGSEALPKVIDVFGSHLIRNPSVLADMFTPLGFASIQPLLNFNDADSDPMIRGAAIIASGQLRSFESVDDLCRLLDVENAANIILILDALGRIKDQRCGSELAKLTVHADETVRRHLADTLGKLKALETLPALVELVSDPSPVVRLHARIAISGFGDIGETLLSTLPESSEPTAKAA